MRFFNMRRHRTALKHFCISPPIEMSPLRPGFDGASLDSLAEPHRATTAGLARKNCLVSVHSLSRWTWCPVCSSAGSHACQDTPLAPKRQLGTQHRQLANGEPHMGFMCRRACTMCVQWTVLSLVSVSLPYLLSCPFFFLPPADQVLKGVEAINFLKRGFALEWRAYCYST